MKKFVSSILSLALFFLLIFSVVTLFNNNIEVMNADEEIMEINVDVEEYVF